ncbi:hypothetical protein HaLaN_03937 [Haematococcus lacustris]|uniref:Uncharacterized protein n=1 Tax=Haematococcus lacustris TaxID=44745 RepID=A0A699YPN6_HAELA|nr:hypothetical protein HaLaN_03937 [Haematococcus lacustris]
MADYAAQLAVYQQAVQAAGQAAPEQLPPDMPPPGWLAAHPQATWHSGAVAQAGPDGFMPAPGPAPGVPFARSESAIRRSYLYENGPMSPFQAPNALKAPEVPEAPKVPTGTPETSLGLPHPPQGITKGPEPDDEYDDLARRLDALKRR